MDDTDRVPNNPHAYRIPRSALESAESARMDALHIVCSAATEGKAFTLDEEEERQARLSGMADAIAVGLNALKALGWVIEPPQVEPHKLKARKKLKGGID